MTSAYGLPYPIFAYAALRPWTFFANSLSGSSSSLLGSSNLIGKVHFPRLISALVGRIDARTEKSI